MTSEQASLFPARAGMMQRGTVGKDCSGMIVVEVSKLSEKCRHFNFRKVGRVVITRLVLYVLLGQDLSGY